MKYFFRNFVGGGSEMVYSFLCEEIEVFGAVLDDVLSFLRFR
jgi:hypothetical protein